MGTPHLALFLSVLGCQSPPEVLADCDALSVPTERENCRFEMIQPLMDDSDALMAALDQITDPASRDLLLLRLATSNPKLNSTLCRQAATTGAQERCQQVLGRPHLSTTRRRSEGAPPQPVAPP